MSDPPRTSAHVRVIVYEPRARTEGDPSSNESSPRLELMTRAAAIPKHVALAAFLFALAGASAWLAVVGDGSVAVWSALCAAVLWPVALGLVRLFLPCRVRLDRDWLRVGMRRYPMRKIFGLAIVSPPVFPDRHNVIAHLDHGGNLFEAPSIGIAVQLPLDDARAVLTMLRRVHRLRDDEAT